MVYLLEVKTIFITTSSYTKPAIEYAQENNIILIDGKELLRLMIDYNVGVETREIVELKKLISISLKMMINDNILV